MTAMQRLKEHPTRTLPQLAELASDRTTNKDMRDAIIAFVWNRFIELGWSGQGTIILPQGQIEGLSSSLQNMVPASSLDALLAAKINDMFPAQLPAVNSISSPEDTIKIDIINGQLLIDQTGDGSGNLASGWERLAVTHTEVGALIETGLLEANRGVRATNDGSVSSIALNTGMLPVFRVDARFAYQMAMDIAGTGNYYAGYYCLDRQGLSINRKHSYIYPGSNTTLAAPYTVGQSGDSTLVLDDASVWSDYVNAQSKNIVFGDYNDGEITYPPHGYSRYASPSATIVLGVSGNTVTIAPTEIDGIASGTVLPIGTPVRLSRASGPQYALAGNLTATANPTKLSSVIKPNIPESYAYARFHQGTEFVRLYLSLARAQGGVAVQQDVANLMFYQLPKYMDGGAIYSAIPNSNVLTWEQQNV